VTGHSLGGAVAQLLAVAFAQDFPSIPVDAALFAPPTAGDPHFAEAFNTMVNGRRVAYVAYDGEPPSLETNMGDAIVQTMCPSMPVCAFPLKDPTSPMPVVTKMDDRKFLNYQEVAGKAASCRQLSMLN